MASDDSETGEELQPFVFTEGHLLEIGRLIRNFSELEDALTHFIQQLSGTHEGAAKIMLGQTGFSKRLEIAKAFIADSGHASAQKVYQVFDSEFTAHARNIRNAVTHGSFLGQSSKGLHWLTDRADKAEPLTFGRIFFFPVNDIAIAAKNVRVALNELEPLMNLKAWQERRRKRPRSPIPNLGKKKDKGEAPQFPPKASPQ